jgi:hypothetical protein
MPVRMPAGGQRERGERSAKQAKIAELAHV